jgi:Pentapeptide repeats (8 copies)
MIDYISMMPAAAPASSTASQSSVIVAIIVAALGAVATFTVGFLNFRTQRRQIALAVSSQMTDRFTKAIDQLGNEKRAVRIGGIFALERIARDSLKDESAEYTLQSIAYTLATFIRDSAPRPAITESSYIEMLKIRSPDVQAAITVLCRSPLCDNRVNASNAELQNLNRTDLRIDLSHTDLRHASLRSARLDGVNLWGSRLEGTNFRYANLRCAGLSDAYVGRLNPKDKKIKYGADLSWADLTDAYQDNVRGLEEAKTDGTVGLRG